MAATKRTAKAAKATAERQRAIQAATDRDEKRKPASKKGRCQALHKRQRIG